MAVTYIKNHSTLETSLVANWGFNEFSSGGGAVTRVDSHGGYDLTDNNTVPSATAVVGKGADFELGNSEYFSRTDDGTFDITTDFSIHLHFNFETAGTSQIPLMAKYASSGNQRAWAFDYFNSTLRFYTSTNGTGATLVTHSVSWTPTIGVDYSIGMSYDLSAGTTKFYVDGVQQGSTQTSGNTSVHNSTSALLVGRASTTSGAYADGVMDELRFWTKIVTDDEFSDLHNSGDGMSYGIQLDSSAGVNTDNSVTSQTTSYTVGPGSNRFLYVMVVGDVAATTGVTSVTYNAENLTKLATNRVGTDRSFDVWYMVAPATGANDVVITRGTSGLIASVFVSYDGVDQDTPTPTTATPTDATSDTTLAESITTTVDNSFAVMAGRDATGRTLTGGTGLTMRVDASSAGMHLGDSATHISPAASHTFNGTYSATCIEAQILFELALSPVAAAAADNALAWCNF
jgi:hypothetical protein